jgi:hypothetical protein
VWKAGWHKVPSTLEALWGEVKMQKYIINSDRRQASSAAKAARIDLLANTAQWVMGKCTSSAKGKQARDENLGRIHGLSAAVALDSESLWNDLLALGTDVSPAYGNDLFRNVMMMLPEAPPQRHEPSQARGCSSWIQEHALADLLAHGARPGGNAWTAVVTSSKSRPLLDVMAPYAASATSARQRAAILVSAADQKVAYFDDLAEVFFPLGFPGVVSLTPSEAKRDADAEALLLENRGADYAYPCNDKMYKDRALYSGNVALKDVLDRAGLSRLYRDRLTEVAAAAAPDVRPAAPKRSM